MEQDAAELKSATVQWLWHTGISEDVKHRPRAYVRDDAGHSSMATTDRYVKSDRQERHFSSRKKRVKDLLRSVCALFVSCRHCEYGCTISHYRMLQLLDRMSASERFPMLLGSFAIIWNSHIYNYYLIYIVTGSLYSKASTLYDTKNMCRKVRLKYLLLITVIELGAYI